MANFIDDSIDFSQYLRETDNKQKVRPASDYLPAIKERMRTMASERKLYMPWVKSYDSFYFREGEMTVWAGQNGHGEDRRPGIRGGRGGRDLPLRVGVGELRDLDAVLRLGGRGFADTAGRQGRRRHRRDDRPGPWLGRRDHREERHADRVQALETGRQARTAGGGRMTKLAAPGKK